MINDRTRNTTIRQKAEKRVEEDHEPIRKASQRRLFGTENAQDDRKKAHSHANAAAMP